MRITLVNIVKQPKWFGRFKFASDRICANIVNELLRNKTIECMGNHQTIALENPLPHEDELMEMPIEGL